MPHPSISGVAYETIATVASRQVLDFMEPFQPSSYQSTLDLAHQQVILNEYWPR